MYNNLKNKYVILLYKLIGSIGFFGEFLLINISSCLGNIVCNY